MLAEPFWTDETARLEKEWADGIPDDYLSHPLIQGVTHVSRHVAAVAKQHLGTAANLDDFVVRNQLHQRYHLHAYRKLIGTDLTKCETYVEFGGGWGCMADIIRHANKTATYTLIDLSIMLEVQRRTLLGHPAVNSQNNEVLPGHVNFVDSDHLHLVRTPDAFLALWSLSESPAELQRQVFEAGLMNNRLLVAYDPAHEMFSGSTHFETLISLEPHQKKKALTDSSYYAFR